MKMGRFIRKFMIGSQICKRCDHSKGQHKKPHLGEGEDQDRRCLVSECNCARFEE